MIVLRRHILPVMLSLLVVLTGQAAAVAHAAPSPSGRIELCTGSGPVMVYVDENGEPVGDPVFCPDFALSLILALDLPPVVAGPVALSVGAISVGLLSKNGRGPAFVDYPARGPPVLI